MLHVYFCVGCRAEVGPRVSGAKHMGHAWSRLGAAELGQSWPCGGGAVCVPLRSVGLLGFASVRRSWAVRG